jgi:hypothetical protein
MPQLECLHIFVVDIDECEEVKCHASATCVNNPGSFVCNCNPGFIGDGVSRCSGTENYLVIKCFTSQCHAKMLYNLCVDPVFNLNLALVIPRKPLRYIVFSLRCSTH